MMNTGDECQITDQNVSGDTVSWQVSCDTEEGAATGTGTFRSAGASAEGSMTIEVNVQGQALQMITHWEGERVGAC